MTMGDGDTLRAYFDRYWELYNEIGGNDEEVAVSTFKLGLPFNSELKGSLTKQPLKNMHQLIRRIEEYKRLENGQLQNRRKGRSLFLTKERIGWEVISKGQGEA